MQEMRGAVAAHAAHLDCGGAALAGVTVVVIYLADERLGRQTPVWMYVVIFCAVNVYIAASRKFLAARYGNQNVAANAVVYVHADDADDDDDTEAEPQYGDFEWSAYDTESERDEWVRGVRSCPVVRCCGLRVRVFSLC